MERRTVLATGGALFSAGCAQLSGLPGLADTTTVRLSKLIVANLDGAGHTFDVRLLDEGEVVFEESWSLKARSGEIAPSRVVTDRLPEAPGEYVLVTAFGNGDDRSEVHPGRATDAGCVVAEVVTLNGDEIDVYVDSDSDCDGEP